VSTVKYGSASSILKKTTGMLDGSGSVGNGASASTDNGNHAGHGSYASASSHTKLPSSNKFASYKTPGMMIYHRPEAVLGRIMDYRVAGSDAFGMGHGSGSDHLAYATSMPQVKDYFLGGGLPTEAVGFIAVQSAAERDKAIAQLKADGFAMINGRPVEDIVITKAEGRDALPERPAAGDQPEQRPADPGPADQLRRPRSGCRGHDRWRGRRMTTPVQFPSPAMVESRPTTSPPTT
jgi:hypothetical protein